MKKLFFLLLTSCFIHVAVAQAPAAPRVIEGKVIENEAEESINEAEVYIAGTNIVTKTDKRGHYKLDLPDSIPSGRNIYVCCKHPGYDADSSKVSLGPALLKVNIVLQQKAVRLQYD